MAASGAARTPLVLLILAAVGIVVALLVARRAMSPAPPDVTPPAAAPAPKAVELAGELRQRLYAELQPVRLANCTLERIGEPHDGGYLMCGNLLQADAGYSYGISGYDGWGCGISTRLKVAVHQYDCFDTRRPRCDGGDMRFHAECIGASASTDANGRPFDSLAHQFSRNGDGGRRVVVKMDVEGAEWDSLLQTPPSVLERIDQLTIEMHGFTREPAKHLEVVSKLKSQFYVAHLHFNNFACRPGDEPFPSWAWEVLFVNKRLGVLAPDQQAVTRPHPLDAANNPTLPDCQYVASGPGEK